MFDPGQLQALAAVLRTGSFDAAATALNVTPSAISQRIRALEEQAGAIAVIRAKPCRPTVLGKRLLRHAEEVARLEQALARDLDVAASGPDPVLRLAVNADSLATWFIDALVGAPGMLFDLVIDDQDHSADLLRRGEVAGAVTGAREAVQGCDCWPLGALRYVPTASPAYVARWFANGVDAAALARAPAIVFNDKDRLQADWLRGHLGRRISFPAHRMATSHGFVDAALADLGWGMNPLPLVARHLAEGRLVELVAGARLDVPLYWQASRIGAPLLAPLTRAVRRAAAQALCL
jgi:LysR family transcriptional regulator (chromosome initiation inhibitor)